MRASRVPLAPLTTLGVGGPALAYEEAATEPAILDALAFAAEGRLAVLVLGGGSNLLVADRGFDGLVLRPRLDHLRAEVEGDRVVVDVGAGLAWDDFVAHAVARGWAGVECLSGIPGDVGATPVQNVGAYGQEVKDTIVSVRAVDRLTREVVTLDAARCAFAYRDSFFKREGKDRFVITSVRFALRLGGAPEIRYPELAKQLGVASPSLAEVRAAVLALRRSKSMLFDLADENGRSAGSFFTNPIVEPALADAVAARAGGDMPRYPAPSGQVKLSAAWLIERAGFRKGDGEGRVGISTRHSLALVNRGGATAAEVVAFARRVQAGVRERLGVTLTPEPVMVGFAPGELL
jgi:UDP-N-acetylmuramate dehydrogenase